LSLFLPLFPPPLHHLAVFPVPSYPVLFCPIVLSCPIPREAKRSIDLSVLSAYPSVCVYRSLVLSCLVPSRLLDVDVLVCSVLCCVVLFCFVLGSVGSVSTVHPPEVHIPEFELNRIEVPEYYVRAMSRVRAGLGWAGRSWLAPPTPFWGYCL